MDKEHDWKWLRAILKGCCCCCRSQQPTWWQEVCVFIHKLNCSPGSTNSLSCWLRTLSIRGGHAMQARLAVIKYVLQTKVGIFSTILLPVIVIFVSARAWLLISAALYERAHHCFYLFPRQQQKGRDWLAPFSTYPLSLHIVLLVYRIDGSMDGRDNPSAAAISSPQPLACFYITILSALAIDR